MSANNLARLAAGAAAGTVLLAMTSCTDPTGPVVGDWRGQQAAAATFLQTQIEVILDGSPGAQTGRYHYLALNQDTTFDVGERHFEWDDRWTMRPVMVNGQTMQFVHLDHLAGARTGDFILTPQNVLVPQPDPARPSLSRDGYRVALYPVPRESFGYGRP